MRSPSFNTAMTAVVLIFILLLVLDLFYTLPEWTEDAIAILTFLIVVDLIVRFYHAPNKMAFFKSNIIEIIALLPFLEELRLFRSEEFIFAKVVRMARPVLKVVAGFFRITGE